MVCIDGPYKGIEFNAETATRATCGLLCGQALIIRPVGPSKTLEVYVRRPADNGWVLCHLGTLPTIPDGV